MATYIWLCLILFSQFTSMLLAETDTYIIHMDLQAMPKLFSGHHDWYDALLSSISNDGEISSSNTPEVHYAYGHAMHGFSARLSSSQLKAVQNSPGFVSAIPDVQATLHTSHSFKFLGLNHYKGAWPLSNYGDDIIIGVVDTGVWPESKSFDDTGMTEVPARWKGGCENGTAFNSSMCNKKLIGARYFNKGLLSNNKSIKIEMNSVRDVEGHGTHTASTAAGSYVQDASFVGYANGTIRGIAPKARVAIYKCFWNEGGGIYASDFLAAVNQAISDGVDILSLSLDFKEINHMYEDPIAISTFAAMEKGIFVSTSAGNRGATHAILSNGVPWALTVGAGTIDREFNGIVTLGNGDSVVGQTLYPGKSFSTQVPMVFMNTCKDSTEINKARHKIVVCIDVNESLEEQIINLLDGQVAGGVFITNDTRLNINLPSPFPAIYLSLQDGKNIQDYITKGSNTTARFEFPKTTNLDTKPAPLVDSYSSRGPSRVCPTVLKPDLIAPGSLILAAWPENVPIANIGSHSLYGKFNLQSGTSMSAPHAAGVAALLKKMHPDWSPAAIRSAMMTTSYAMDNTKGPIKDIGKFHATADPLAMGAGHVNPNKALDPGLVYDANADDYVRLLCGMNYTMKQIQTITRSSRYNCSDASLDLNYPSFIAYFETTNSSGRIQEFKRTVTNVGDGLSNYTAFLTPVDGYKVKVVPGTLTFTEKYQRRSYTLYVERVAVMVEGVSHGALTWVDIGRKHVVRSPIVTTTLGSELLS